MCRELTIVSERKRTILKYGQYLAIGYLFIICQSHFHRKTCSCATIYIVIEYPLLMFS